MQEDRIKAQQLAQQSFQAQADPSKFLAQELAKQQTAVRRKQEEIIRKIEREQHREARYLAWRQRGQQFWEVQQLKSAAVERVKTQQEVENRVKKELNEMRRRDRRETARKLAEYRESVRQAVRDRLSNA